MPDAIIQISFDGGPTLSFVAGEDRLFSMAFTDGRTGAPIDLTGAYVAVSVPGASGLTLRRTSAPYGLLPGSISPVNETITYPDHGLVNGDSVVFSGSSLPVPLVAGTTYLVANAGAGVFSLTDLSGNAINLTTTGAGTFSMLQAGYLTVTLPSAGLASVLFPAAFTGAVEPGAGQGFQVSVIQSGKTRIVVIGNELDVTAQPAP